VRQIVLSEPILKASRIFVLIYTVVVPLFILITFLFFDFPLAWLPYDWSTNSKTVVILVNYVAPILYCIMWLYFNILLANRFSQTIEIMQGTSSSISAHYLIFYGVNALVIMFAFLSPVITPVVGVLSSASLMFTILTSKVSWEELDEKTRKFVKTVSILSGIPVLFVSILVAPDLMVLAIDFFKNIWVKTVDPLFWLMKAFGVAIPIGHFMNLYRQGVREAEGKQYTQSRLGIYITELFITAFLYFLESQGVEFVTYLYYVGVVFWVLSFIANVKIGKTKEGKLIENPLGLILNLVFWIAWFVIGSDKIDPAYAWVKLALVILSAKYFISSSPSPSLIPRKTRTPLPILPIVCPPTFTSAFLTR